MENTMNENYLAKMYTYADNLHRLFAGHRVSTLKALNSAINRYLLNKHETIIPVYFYRELSIGATVRITDTPNALTDDSTDRSYYIADIMYVPEEHCLDIFVEP